MNEALTTQAAAQLVPASYAEKAMASLMQLHSELMDEKEKRVDLFRRLMEREQALAELKMYVKMLEEKMSASPSATRNEAPPVAPPPQPRPIVMTPAQPQMTRPSPPRVAPVPPRIPPRPRIEGWKTW
jgi:hypothetical protein